MIAFGVTEAADANAKHAFAAVKANLLRSWGHAHSATHVGDRACHTCEGVNIDTSFVFVPITWQLGLSSPKKDATHDHQRRTVHPDSLSVPPNDPRERPASAEEPRSRVRHELQAPGAVLEAQTLHQDLGGSRAGRDDLARPSRCSPWKEGRSVPMTKHRKS